ncbi:hypothetical protein BDK51DRAFT_21781 [Blyttiomyces helicus]|uniref:C-factor n=1 Tax=Blyttiomyces helicus TaxID=388810 RepID=A0A4P9W9I7_9FUNG|nr:hypothetical protein BDK51DRAFT_21781 [Blyttiomyces helicus]|eukprot:RKO89219.1 hypothetical protein BDK51DRAFT_21781 [Blyttiomyces helicus]
MIGGEGALGAPVWVNISARTGSIGDNGLGGWYSYRVMKAGLNQFTKTLSCELGRKGVTVISYHPGTVDTDLSRKFVKGVDPAKLFSPDQAAAYMLAVIQGLKETDNGTFVDFAGKPIPW